MNNNQIEVLAKIYAANARIEGYKAENQHRKMMDGGVCYDQKYFDEQASIIEEVIKYLEPDGHLRNNINIDMGDVEFNDGVKLLELLKKYPHLLRSGE